METTFSIPTTLPSLPKITLAVTLDSTTAVNVGVPVHDNVSNPRFPRISATPCTLSHHHDPSTTNQHPSLDEEFNKNGENYSHVEAFWLPPAKIQPIQIGSWIGSLEKGANVNCDLVEFCAHGCATHTECVSHITLDSHSILHHIPTAPLPALVLTPTFCTYQEFTQSLSPNFPATIPVNSTYQPDDIVLSGLNGFVSSLVAILTQLQSTFNLATDWNPQSLIAHPHIDTIITQIPADLLTILRLLSKAIVLRTYLPQTMMISHQLNKLDQAPPNPSQLLPAIQHHLLSRFHPAHSTPPASEHDSLITAAIDQPAESISIVYNNTNPPYIPSQLMYILCALFEPHHILVDLPSVDKEDDGGKTLAHKLHFFSSFRQPIPPTTSPTSQSNSNYHFLHNCVPSMVEKRTITELCFFPSDKDATRPLPNPGHVVLCDLRTAPIESDATPSMPLLYPVTFQ